MSEIFYFHPIKKCGQNLVKHIFKTPTLIALTALCTKQALLMK
jgi:hypothetical protein